MKTARGVLTVLLVLLMAVSLAVAQGREGGRPRGERGERQQQRGAGQGGRLPQVLGELDLTDAQREQIEKIRADFEKRTQEMRGQMRGTFEEMRKFRQENPNDQEGLRKKREEMRGKLAPMREAMQGFMEEVKAVLTEEQLKKFEELTAQRRGQRFAGGQGQAGGPPGVSPQVIQQLQLNDEQKEKLAGLLLRYLEEQRQLTERFQGQFRALLTPEQQQKLGQVGPPQEMRGRFGARRGDQERGERPDRGERRRPRRGGEEENAE